MWQCSKCGNRFRGHFTGTQCPVCKHPYSAAHVALGILPGYGVVFSTDEQGAREAALGDSRFIRFDLPEERTDKFRRHTFFRWNEDDLRQTRHNARANGKFGRKEVK